MKLTLLGVGLTAIAFLALGCAPTTESEAQTESPAQATAQAPTDLVATAVGAPADVKKAPDFTAMGSDGEEHTLASLHNGETLVLYFIKDGCPINEPAVPYFEQIASNYAENEDKVRFVGVINDDAAAFAKWNEKHDVPFLVLMDPDKKIIDAYEVASSPWVKVIDPQGNITIVQEGYGKGSLVELNEAMAAAAGVSAGDIDTTGAPDRNRFG